MNPPQEYHLYLSTVLKASGGDGIPVELFQILKDDAMKVLHSICQQIWKTQQWPQDKGHYYYAKKKKKGKKWSTELRTEIPDTDSSVTLKRLLCFLTYKISW